MADSSIGALPQAPQIDDDSLLVMEQQGQAMKVTGAQFKDFGRQAVIGQVQGYVDAAEAAAAEAVDAVSTVTDMTVSAQPSPEASVSKSLREGKVHLTFGLPRGERGEPGPEGPQGLRGPQGAPGNGLTLLGHYDTEAALREAVTSPEVGNAYSVGTELPYDTWVFDGVTLDWKNYGPLSGGGGTILPENVVTTPGGAALAFSSGDGPHTVEFDFEEEPPLTAGDIVYGEGTVEEAIDGLFTSVSDGKALIASAVTDKGVETASDASFAEMAENIGKITTGGDTSDATATPGDILSGKTAYTAAGKVEGIVPRLEARTYTPGTADQTIANGQYLEGTQTIKGDPNLTSGNIRKGVSLFGVEGAVESSFQAVLTVTADIGAVVTATNGGTTVEALSTTGTVVLELPHEGTWKVTAQRGMAQYNTVLVEVSSQYSAALTAEVHVEYYIQGTPLSYKVANLTGVSIGDYALFIGGESGSNVTTSSGYAKPPARVFQLGSDAYDISLTRINGPETMLQTMPSSPPFSVVTATSKYAFVWGGYNVVAVDTSLAKVTNELMLSADPHIAAALGDRAIFVSEDGAYVDVLTDNLTKTEATPLISSRKNFTAASNENYIVLAGGITVEGGWTPFAVVDAYDKNMTRTTPSLLGAARGDAVGVRAGNYILICGGQASDVVDAYDLFLTRTTPEPLGAARAYFAAVTLKNVAVLGGGGPWERLSFDSEPLSENNAEIYDPYLVRTKVQDLSSGRSFLAAASVGDYALFAGGGRHIRAEVRPNTFTTYYTGSATVDVYRYV